MEQLQHFIDYTYAFRFVPGVTPLATAQEAAVFTVGYVISFFILRIVLRNAPILDLKYLRAAHNLFLCVFSAVSLVAISYEVARMYSVAGYISLVCDPARTHIDGSSLYFWYYVFYLSKFYEFLDTLILLLRKKPVIFLHVWHHFTTAWLCWANIAYFMSIQWLCITANALVHVLMYYYYFSATVGLDVWFKKYITSMQIVQFVVDIVANFLFLYHSWYEDLECTGPTWLFFPSQGLLLSFLLLFLVFYRSSYSRGGAAAGGADGKRRAQKTE